MTAVTARRRGGPPIRPAAVAQPGVHRCPGAGCPRHVSPGHVACRECWLRIPKPDRALLGAAFRRADPVLHAHAAAITKALVLQHVRPVETVDVVGGLL